MNKETELWFKKCEDLFRECIRIRDNNTCQITGANGRCEILEVSHYIRRGKKSVRWDPNNAMLIKYDIHRNTPEKELKLIFEKKYPRRASIAQKRQKKYFRVNVPNLKDKHDQLVELKQKFEEAKND